MYTVEGRIGYSECDDKWRLTIPGLIDRFQNCSTFQSEDLSMGKKFIEENHAAWILASWDIKINRLPFHGEYVETATWPYAFNGLFGLRNHTMKAKDGELLAFADSQWFYFDFDRKRPVKVPDFVAKGYESSFADKLDEDFSARKIPVPEGLVDGEAFTVKQRDIDTNNHVNNGVYPAMASDLLPPSDRIAEVRIEYVRAAVLNDRIIPSVKTEEGLTVVNLKGEDGKSFVVIETRER